MGEAVPRLLHFRVSHYNEKVRWALDHKRWPHVRRSLVPGFHVPVVRRLTGQNQVPVLELEGEFLTDSTRIIAELERRRPEPPLYPSDPEARERALAIETWFDDEVAPDMRRLFWSTYLPHPLASARLSTDGFGAAKRWLWLAMFPVIRMAMPRNMGLDATRLERAHERLGTYFDRIEADTAKTGYFVGDSFTIADLTAAAVMTAIVRPPEFSYPLPEPRPREFVELQASVAGRDGFRWVREIYARHRGSSAEIRQ